MLLAALWSGALAVAGACGKHDAPSPFDGDLGFGGFGGQGGASSSYDAGSDAADDTLGGPCSVDAQCDDGVECTFDECDDELKLCRFTPDDSQCQNGLYCDGLEVCDGKIGCVLGEPVTCSDGNPCHINTCLEASKSCASVPRDVDGDGDPDVHCGGGDCDDQDPAVSSLTAEVCANGRDDDCDKQVDEVDCTTPANDDCFDPLALTQAGSYQLVTAAATLDYAASCTVQNPALARDVVAAVMLAAGPPVDVQLTAKAEQADVALALMGQCAQAQSEIACSPGYGHPDGGRVAKVRGRGLGDPSQPLALPAYVFTDQGTKVTLRYELLPASQKPANETCGLAETVLPGKPALASVVDASPDVQSACNPATGDLLYRFVLAEPADVDLYATSVDGDGLPIVSLRAVACALPADEIACSTAPSSKQSAHLFRHALAAGTYFVAVAATAPTDVMLSLATSAPSAPQADEQCTGAPAIAPNKTIDVALGGHQDDHHTGCLPGGTDAVYALKLAQKSDVLLLGRYSNKDVAAVVLAQEPCQSGQQIVCGSGQISPARGQARGVPPGDYRVIAESQQAQPMQLTALVRPASPPTLVPFADSCDDVLSVPAAGGFFQGTTANAQPHYNAGCDLGGQPQGGAPDQILKLALPKPKRVVLDMQGSAYATVLDVREHTGMCPGTELGGACAAGYYPERSFLDLELPAGSYYIQIDGYGGQSGPWFLDVFVVDP